MFRLTPFPGRAGAMVLALTGLFAADCGAVTLRVGPSAGQPGSACQFDAVQAAIDALPNDGQLHRVELAEHRYLDDAAVVAVDGRRVEIVTRFGDANCTIFAENPLAELVAGNGQSAGRTVQVRNGGELILDSIKVADNPHGGLVVRDASLTLRNVFVIGNRTPAGASGAGIVVEGGSVVIDGGMLADNQAGANGGALFCSRSSAMQAQVRVSGQTSFFSNSARHGGAIYLFRGCRLSLNGAEFRDNFAEFDGGAVATEPRTSAEGERNDVRLESDNQFTGNRVGRHGGALHVNGGNHLFSNLLSHQRFLSNEASNGIGGALRIVGDGPEARVMNAKFIGNHAGLRGGAVAVEGRNVRLEADCAAGETSFEDYCALFEGNTVPTGSPGQVRRGGAIDIDGGGTVIIRGYAFRDSQGPETVNGDSGGLVAALRDGTLELRSSLVFDTATGLTPNSHLFYIKAGGSARFEFNTMVDMPAGSTVFMQPGSAVSMVGNIIAGNAGGVFNNGGTLTGTCNNVQLGTAPVSLDPGFVTTSAGRYRLGADSPMIDRGLTCNANALPPGFIPPVIDLIRRERIEPGEAPMAIDLGAFEHRLADELIFDNGFEDSPR